MKRIIQRALRQSRVNGATTLKLYGYIGIGKYLGKIFPPGGVWGGAGPLNVNLGPPDISETTTAGKLNLKIPLDMVKYPHWIQNYYIIRYNTRTAAILIFNKMSIFEADYG